MWPVISVYSFDLCKNPCYFYGKTKFYSLLDSKRLIIIKTPHLKYIIF